MVGRVLIKANDLESVLRVSLPGYDVNSASLSQLAFDARFSCLEIFRQGVVSLPTGGSGTSLSGPEHTFGYGETLSEPPLGFFVFGDIGGPGPFVNISNTSGGSFSISSRLVRLTTSAMIARWDFSSAMLLRYILFRAITA